MVTVGYSSDVLNVTLISLEKVVSNCKTSEIIIGVLTALSNLIVVVSSGLILRNGQQPKNTYLLLGNVSLADTMVGLFIINSGVGGHLAVSSPICIFKIGVVLCAAFVSIFSVALIAADRYCYIIYGLHYHRYCTTRRVRISIALTWILGITLGFIPGSGLTNQNVDKNSRCSYLSLFPNYLVLLNAFIGFISLVFVAILYSIILMNALQSVKSIKALRITSKNNKETKTGDNSLTIYKNNIVDCNTKLLFQSKNVYTTLKRSISCPYNKDHLNVNWKQLNHKSKSIENLKFEEPQEQLYLKHTKTTLKDTTHSKQNVKRKSRIDDVDVNYTNIKKRNKEPSKLRAVIVVSLTSGCVLVTWMPLCVIIILYALCEHKQSNAQCLQYKLLMAPFLTLAYMNSLFNPLVYAWWHKGFKKSIKNYYRRHITQYTMR